MIPFLSIITLILFCLISQTDSATSRFTPFFSPKGELEQVEYARNAAKQGQTILGGVCINNNVLLCIPTKRYIQKLVDFRKSDKIMKIDKNVYMAFAGIAGDGKALAMKAQKFCISNRAKFGFMLNPFGLAGLIGREQHKHTQFEGLKFHILINRLL